ncbi:hypothetical protein [Klebsiella pneumoniae]|uniref:hypothetical protein n=1 Tax=Klebsiella pneumoniae TaxID=573 RepID=UPI002948D559|nr:hypothetical protein [Klebsiella pneumoniae]MDV5550478.1 hypothetical protein [Klebsiella pneumoniae]
MPGVSASARLTLDEEKAAKFPPTVRAAVLGLELDLLHYRHIDRRDPAIPVAHWQEDVIPPFAFESDAEAEDEPATPPAARTTPRNNSLRLTDDEPTPAKPQPATRPDHLNSKRGSMNPTVKTDRNTLYLSADGNYQNKPCTPSPVSLSFLTWP